MGIYLDNAATSYPKPESVYRAVDSALREVGVAPGRGGYRRALAAAHVVFEAREAAARLLGVADSSRVVFTQNATEALNLAVSGLLVPGDHVITSTMEHNSLARPLYRAESRGVRVTRVGASADGTIDPATVAAAVTSRTRMLAFSHCSNVTGTIQPLAHLAEIARGSGALLLLDAAQSAGSLPVHVGEMGIHLLAAPGHKGLLGPQGTGLLYIDPTLELEPLMVGGTGGSSSGTEHPAAMPERFESGTHNTAGIAGLKAGIEFILAEGRETIRCHEERLTAALMEGLATLPGCTLWGPTIGVPRGAVVSFTLDGRDPAEIGFLLDHRYDIQVRVGLHCASEAHRTIGTYPTGTIRVSPGYFNTGDQVATFLSALREIVA